MVKPDECIFLRARREIAEIRDILDARLVQDYKTSSSITIVIPASSDAIREQVALLYSAHWSLIHGRSTLNGEHWITFDCLNDDFFVVIDGDSLTLWEDPTFDGREVTFKVSLGNPDGGEAEKVASTKAFSRWEMVAPRIPARIITDEGFSKVYHPMLAERGIDRLLFVERSAFTKDDAGNWTVTIKGVSTLRKSKP